MDAGRIVEEGTHASLLAQGKMYAMLVRRQTGHSADLAPPGNDGKPSPGLMAKVMQTIVIKTTLQCKKAAKPCRCV